MRFARCLSVVRRWEGGLVDHPQDPGGITKWGISLRFLRGIGFDVNGDGVIDGRDIRGLTEGEVEAIYRQHFWDKVSAEDLPIGIDLAVFDCAVNQGPGRAKRFLQKAAKVKADGIIGPKTLAAINASNHHWLLVEFMTLRQRHYTSLVNWAVFGTGWTRRLFDVGFHAIIQMQQRG